MSQHKCPHCGNRFHWREAFAKFGHDDGDGHVQTHAVAEALRQSGHAVKYSKWGPHNIIIHSIKKDGIELMPIHNPRFIVGYDDPRDYLPQDIQEILNREFSPVKLFH